MKLSDYVIECIEQRGVKDVFLLSGGGMMHLLDSLNSSGLHAYYNLNEQATTICGDAYAQYTNDLSVCMVTTGPGATNAVTGVVSAYQDSTPMLVISGQVKTADLAPEGVRVYGAQEVNITGMVKGVTKYAETVMKPNDIRYHMEKAIYLATHGRRGPVWIDIPLDIQAAEIIPEECDGYCPENEQSNLDRKSVCSVADALEQAERPVVLLGHGVVAAKAFEQVKKLRDILKAPLLTTWRGKELFREEDAYYFGEPGAQAPRYSNFILQKADFVLVVGSRLDWSLTAFNEPAFAPGAKKYIVDVEQPEMDKLSICFEEKIHSDAGVFLDALLHELYQRKPHTERYDQWVEKCNEWKEKYPISKEKMDIISEGVWGYDFADCLNKYAGEDEIFVASPTGRVCIAMNLGIKLRERQRFIAPRGLGSMGYALPCAIGSCVAGGKRRTICFEGDGSLQHNIQELQLIVTYELPIKLFIYNNGGYSSIYGMQWNHFQGRLAGCNAESGVKLPDLKRIASAYGIRYSEIRDTAALEEGVRQALADDEPMIIEVMGDIRYEEIPRTQTRVHEDGTISSSSMEDLYPFLEVQE